MIIQKLFDKKSQNYKIIKSQNKKNEINRRLV